MTPDQITILVAATCLTLVWFLGESRGYRKGKKAGYVAGYRAGWIGRKTAEFARIYGLPPERVIVANPPRTPIDATARACVNQCEAAECLESGTCCYNGGKWR